MQRGGRDRKEHAAPGGTSEPPPHPPVMPWKGWLAAVKASASAASYGRSPGTKPAADLRRLPPPSRTAAVPVPGPPAGGASPGSSKPCSPAGCPALCLPRPRGSSPSRSSSASLLASCRRRFRLSLCVAAASGGPACHTNQGEQGSLARHKHSFEPGLHAVLSAAATRNPPGTHLSGRCWAPTIRRAAAGVALEQHQPSPPLDSSDRHASAGAALSNQHPGLHLTPAMHQAGLGAARAGRPVLWPAAAPAAHLQPPRPPRAAAKAPAPSQPPPPPRLAPSVLRLRLHWRHRLGGRRRERSTALRNQRLAGRAGLVGDRAPPGAQRRSPARLAEERQGVRSPVGNQYSIAAEHSAERGEGRGELTWLAQGMRVGGGCRPRRLLPDAHVHAQRSPAGRLLRGCTAQQAGQQNRIREERSGPAVAGAQRKQRAAAGHGIGSARCSRAGRAARGIAATCCLALASALPASWALTKGGQRLCGADLQVTHHLPEGDRADLAGGGLVHAVPAAHRHSGTAVSWR
jgi:hypothetical protein